MQEQRRTSSATDDPTEWLHYWRSFGDRYVADDEPWRTQPLISPERQQLLAARLAVAPDIEESRFPFKDIALTRADIEWLLDAHRDGQGPLDWDDPDQQGQSGLDLRGADLRHVDLSHLPLAGLTGGLTSLESLVSTAEQEEAAAVQMQGAHLYFAHLEGAQLAGAHLDDADLARTRLQDAHLASAHLARVDLRAAHLERAILEAAHLEGADLTRAHLDEANLRGAHCENADLKFALLHRADLRGAHCEGADLTRAHLEGADLARCFFDGATTLDRVYFCDREHGCARLADVQWGDVNLSVVTWSSVKTLTGRRPARHHDRDTHEYVAPRQESIYFYEEAVRTNRQIAIHLYNQGLNEEGARFSHAAYSIRRQIYRLKHRYIRYGLSCLIAVLAGYGYTPLRILMWYVAINTVCAVIYSRLGSPDPIVESITAFHGRGFFSEQFRLGNPEYRIAASEAVIGLLIEICFIATFTQRFLGRGSDT